MFTSSLESFNAGGSVKDRIALNMIEVAEEEGLLKPGYTIVEPTSGNTGVGLAMLAAAKGYKAIFVMPDTMSMERRLLLAAYGAELVLTPGAEGMNGSIAKAREIAAQPEHFMPMQFDNPANPAVHEAITGPEIIEAFEGKTPDAFIAGVGTGGTVTGVGKALRKVNPNVEIYASGADRLGCTERKAERPAQNPGYRGGLYPVCLGHDTLQRYRPSLQ